MKIVFFGSSDFSIPSYEACQKNNREVVLTVSTPDKKKGRGLKFQPTPVSLLAKERNLNLICPNSLKDEALVEQVRDLKPDLFVVASYGKLIPDAWLAVPSIKPLNVHPSLLPLYRGATPLNWPILNGDAKTGVSIAEVTSALDAGDIFEQIEYVIPEGMNSHDLSAELAVLSVEALERVLSRLEKGQALIGKKQSEDESCYAGKLEKKDGEIDWTKPAAEIVNKIRGLQPWPMAYSFYQGQRLQLIDAKVENPPNHTDLLSSGIIAEVSKDVLYVWSGNGCVALQSLKPEGKKQMSAADFARGKRVEIGTLMG